MTKRRYSDNRDVRRRVCSPVMVGRSAELGRLHDALAQAMTAPGAGAGAAVMLGGEAGIGKTRLIEEFLAGLTAPVRVLRGGCVPLADGLLPYAPMVEALHGVEPGGWPGDAVLPGSGPGSAPLDPVPALPNDFDQHRFFAAVRRVLEQLAAQQPLVLVLEDLHWCRLLDAGAAGLSRTWAARTHRPDAAARLVPQRRGLRPASACARCSLSSTGVTSSGSSWTASPRPRSRNRSPASSGSSRKPL